MTTIPSSWPQQFPYARWYLDAVSGSQGWEYIEVSDKDGKTECILPFQLRKRWGVRVLTAPPLTPRLGPKVHFPNNLITEQQKLAFLHRVLAAVDEALPKADFYRISWPFELQYGLPWQMRGWQQRVRYSYVLPLDKPVSVLWDNMKASLRNKIRKGQRNVQIEHSDDWQLLYKLVDRVFTHRKAKRQLSEDLIASLHLAAKKQHACQLWVARGADEQPHAALWLCYDKGCSHNLLLGSDPDLRQSGAVAVLLWHAIQWSQSQGLTHFDFEGSHLAGVESFFRSFGAEAWPYYEFVKGKKWLLALRQLHMGL